VPMRFLRHGLIEWENPGRNQGSFTQHRLSLKGCSPAEPLFVSPDASMINNDLEFQLSRSLFLSNEWGVEYIATRYRQA
jgi:hypothetical protein